MRAQIFKYWDRVRSSFWFVPAIMAAGAVAVAFISVTLDETVKDWSMLGLNWIFSGDAEGATAILGDRRRIDDHHHRGGFLHDPGHSVAHIITARAAPAPQFHERYDHPNGARHVRFHLPVLPAHPSNRSPCGGGRIHPAPVSIHGSVGEQENLVIRLARRPGHYIVADCPLAMVWSENQLSDTIKKRINTAFALGSQRTPGQDIEFSVNQLVEIAVRALSPGVNDPFTAVSCVDHLGSALCRLAQRELPSPYRHDRQDQLRLIAPAVTFAEITDAAFNQIRQYSRSSAAVTIRMLETIAVIAEFAHRPAERAALLRHAEMIARGARDGLPEVEDRGAVEEAYQAACLACRKPARPGL